jgi:DNA-binding CsgD family transcriptional regulator
MLHAAMRREEADELAERVLAHGLPAQEEAELRLSLAARIMSDPGDRVEHSRRALALGGVSEAVRVQHRAWLAQTLASHGALAEAQAAAQAALDDADATGDRSAAALARIALTAVDCRRGRLVEALERVEDDLRSAGGQPLAVSLLRFHQGQLLGALGRMDEAMAVCRESTALAQRQHQSYNLHGWVAFASRLHLSAGRIADARAEAEAGEAMTLSAHPTNPPGASALVARAQIALHTDDARLLRAAVEDARGSMGSGSLLMREHARWTLALAAGDAREAARWVGEDYAVPTLPCDPAFHVMAARIARRAGDRRIAARARENAARLGSCNRLLAGLEAHVEGLLDHDARSLMRAVELIRGSQRPLALASALEDAGRALGADGAEPLVEAHELYGAAGASADARRVSRRLRARGIRRQAARAKAGWDSLTESELRVVRLVGSGATNRDVAERLVLSPHTVSTHLRHAFGKLGINSRVELARMVAERS